MELQTSALLFWWRINNIRAYTELWNGTNWTEVNDLNTAREIGGGAGTAVQQL